MKEDIILDDAVISTDVDNLVKVLSKERKIELSDLARKVGLGRRDIEKWLNILEDEGYIKLEYRLTKTYVMWAGIESQTASYEELEELNGPELRFEKPPKEEPPEEQEKLEKKKDQPDGKDEFEEIIEIEEGEPEKIDELNEFPAHKFGDEKILEENELEKLSYESKKDEDEQIEFVNNPDGGNGDSGGEEEPDDAELNAEEESSNEESPDGGEPLEAVEDPEPEDEIVEGVLKQGNPEESLDAEYSGEEYHLEQPLDSFKELEEEELKSEKFSNPKRRRSKTLRKVLSKYLDEINAQKEEIERLKKEKQIVYKERVMPLEAKMSTDLSLFTETLLKKEQKIIDLREKALELPDRVDELDGLQRTINKIDYDASTAISQTKKRLNSLVGNLKEAKEKLSVRIEKTRDVVESEKKRVEILSEDLSGLDDSCSELEQSIRNAEPKIREINELMDSLRVSLDDLRESKVDLREQIDDVEHIVVKREKQLESLSDGFEEIENVEQQIRSYVDDYEKKIEEINDYLKTSDDELTELRKSANAEHVRKYLTDLEGLLSEYEVELEGIAEREENIDERMAGARQRLSSLIAESKEAIKGMRNKVKGIKEFKTLSKRMKETGEAVLEKVKKKKGERKALQAEVKALGSKRKQSSTKKGKKKPNKKTEKKKKGKKK